MVQQFGGRDVLPGGQVDLVEENWKPAYPVMIEFPSRGQAHRWYDSHEYRQLKSLRLSAGRFNTVFSEGF